MGKNSWGLSLAALILAGLSATSCGSGHKQSYLQSMSISPAAADAKDYSGGEVQFTTTGYYVNPTRTVTPQAANWVACQNEVPTNMVSVSSAGLAQCGPGAGGTYSINAWNPNTGPGVYSCPSPNACGGGCTIAATAQLTCP